MHEEQKEILRQKIYNTLCYTCNIGPSEFSPKILINYGKYEQLGECADDLTYEHNPEALGINIIL